MPFQMVLAAALAIYFHVNLPVSVALVWITNPVTMPPMFYLAYLIGAKLLNHPPQQFTFEASWAWIESSISTIGPPFLFGCLVLGVVSADGIFCNQECLAVLYLSAVAKTTQVIAAGSNITGAAHIVLALTKLGNPKHIQPTKTKNPAMAGFLLFRMCLSLISARPGRWPGLFDWP